MKITNVLTVVVNCGRVMMVPTVEEEIVVPVVVDEIPGFQILNLQNVLSNNIFIWNKNKISLNKPLP